MHLAYFHQINHNLPKISEDYPIPRLEEYQLSRLNPRSQVIESRELEWILE